jgi:O-acetyl-ADP-ribose deacetylase (regulator of RNase III)
MEIVVQQGDLIQVKADAVVNPANSLGEMCGGLAAALRQAGGPEIEQEAMSLAPIPVGEAVFTSAGKLPFKGIVHAPTMEKPGQTTHVDKVRKATLAALLCADSYGVKVLAMPGLGTGVGGVSASAAADVMVETLRNYETASVRKVILIDTDSAMVAAFRNALFAERS